GGNAGTSFALARYWGDNSPPSYAEGSGNAVFVNSVYQQLLGRPVDQGGVTGWVNWLSSGASRAQVVAGIEASREYLTRVVDNLYTTLLGRAADPGGENAFVIALVYGLYMELVDVVYIASHETLPINVHDHCDIHKVD